MQTEHSSSCVPSASKKTWLLCVFLWLMARLRLAKGHIWPPRLGFGDPWHRAWFHQRPWKEVLPMPKAHVRTKEWVECTQWYCNLLILCHQVNVLNVSQPMWGPLHKLDTCIWFILHFQPLLIGFFLFGRRLSKPHNTAPKKSTLLG